MAAEQPTPRTLVLTDICTDSVREMDVDRPQRQTRLARELVQRAVVAGDRSGGLKAIELVGELVADPDRPHAREDLADLRAVIAELAGHTPIIAAPVANQVDLARDVFGDSPPVGRPLTDIAAQTGRLCEWPYPYALVGDNGSAVQHEQLVNTLEGLFDTHVHSQFAYCATTVNIDGAIQRADLFGLAGLCLTEHAGQLYVSANDFWAARFIQEPGLWKRGADARVDSYNALTDAARSDRVLVGYETELDRNGDLILRDQDRARADIILGAIHWLNVDPDGLTDAQYEAAFCRQTEQLLAAGIDVLAHPVRLFWRGKRSLNEEVFRTVAAMLAQANVVAEINIHKNNPPDLFVDACLEAGAAITFGSDSHCIFQVGNFGPHAAMLRRLTGQDDISGLLWRPTRRGQ